MPPRGTKHWCKHCKKSFPSAMSLGGHMNLHRGRRKKQPRSTPSPPSIGARSGRYGLRERPQRTWWLSDSNSSDDEPWTLVSKTECQLCFKVFASCDALWMHMKAHEHQEENTMVEHKASGKVAAWSNGDSDCNFTVSASPGKRKWSRRRILDGVPTPVMMTYGIEEVDAACILLKLSGDPDKYSASVDCYEDCEMDGNLANDMQMTEKDLTSSDRGLIWETELIKPENSSSDEEMMFGSLSHVLNKLCGEVVASGQALGGHMKGHNYPDRETVATFPKFAVTQPRKQLLEVDAACILLKLSGDPDKYSASVDCYEDCEMDGNLAYHMQMTEKDLTSSDRGLIWETELIKPENSSSDEEMMFGSLSHVLNKLCGEVVASGQALGGHMKGHNYPDRETVATFPKFAVTQPRKQLLEVDHESLSLNLPALSDRDYSISRGKI